MQLVLLLGISTCNIFALSVNWFHDTKRMYVSCLPLNSLVISHERRDSSFSFIINTKQETRNMNKTLNTVEMVPGFWHQGPEFLIVGFTWDEVFDSGLSSCFETGLSGGASKGQ